jgi:hypothetical protein
MVAPFMVIYLRDGQNRIVFTGQNPAPIWYLAAETKAIIFTNREDEGTLSTPSTKT